MKGTRRNSPGHGDGGDVSDRGSSLVRIYLSRVAVVPFSLLTMVSYCFHFM